MTNQHGLNSRTRRFAMVAAAGLVVALGTAACGDQTSVESASNASAPGATKPKHPTEIGVAPQTFTPVVASTVGPETAAVRGTDGRYHVVYELQLTNAKPVPATIRSVAVLDEADRDRVITRFQGSRLVESMRTLAPSPVENTTIEPNGSRLLFVDLTFDSLDEVPQTLIHRFRLLGAANPGSTEPTPLTYTITPFEIGNLRPVVVGPPLRGDGWVAFNGCCDLRFAHRGAVQSVNGGLFDSQRFAIDYMRLDDSGHFVTGDVTNPQNWTQYGSEVIAAANGTVVSVANNFPNQVPGSLPDPGSFDTIESVDGNHVILKLRNGVYAFYAHLEKGSVVVEPGDKVKRGDKLGLLGNTGNTSAPHLHFHIMSGPEALASDALPFVVDSFGYEGQVPLQTALESDDLTEDFGTDRHPPVPRRNELPLNLAIVGFAGD
ncbi:MAG TPA: M23 family metallopeptidase [Nocardioidaceae bacterium]|nr:M23 family metallopeptidase [Nocardioidaceae bacterium]